MNRDIEVLPNGDWGFAVDDSQGMTPEEAISFMRGIADLRQGKVRSIEEINTSLKESN